jgi:hypothetical protein
MQIISCLDDHSATTRSITCQVLEKLLTLCKDHYNGRYSRKNAQVVTNLQQTCSNAVPTTYQQVVFALLVPSLLTSCYHTRKNLASCSKSANKQVNTLCSHVTLFCSQVVIKFGTSCSQLVTILMALSDLLQCCSNTSEQSWYNNIVTTLCRQPCNILVISWLYIWDLLQVVPTTCYHPAIQRFVNKLRVITLYTRKNSQVVTGLQTSCYKSANKPSTSCVRTACSQLL